MASNKKKLIVFEDKLTLVWWIMCLEKMYIHNRIQSYRQLFVLVAKLLYNYYTMSVRMSIRQVRGKRDRTN